MPSLVAFLTSLNENPPVKDKSLPTIVAITVVLALLGFFLLSNLSFDFNWSKAKPGNVATSGKKDSVQPVEESETPEAPAKTASSGGGGLSQWLMSVAEEFMRYHHEMKGRGAIPNEAVLEFKDRAAYQKFLAKAEANGLKVKGKMDGLMAVRVGFEDEAALRKFMAENPDNGASLGANYTVSAPPIPTAADRANSSDVPFGGSGLDFIGASNNANWGTGVKIAILDSAVSAENVFGQRLLTQQLATQATTDLSHGTAVASIAAGTIGVAPGSSILSIGVVSADGLSDTFTLANGIMSAVDQGAKVLNISLGSYGDSSVLEKAVAYAYEKGAVVVASAGNDGYTDSTYPARYEHVVAVGAVDAYGQVVSFSNASQNYGLTAPGLEVLAAATGGQQELFSGTSAAAPFVAGAIASVMSQNPGMSAQDATALLQTYANDAGAPGVDADFGYGIIDLNRVENRSVPNLTDAAVASHYFNAKANGGPTMDYVVQNQGTSALMNWQLQTNSGGTMETWNIPILQPNQVTVISVPTSGLDLTAGQQFQSRLLPPTGVVDIDRANNARASVVQKNP